MSDPASEIDAILTDMHDRYMNMAGYARDVDGNWIAAPRSSRHHDYGIEANAVHRCRSAVRGYFASGMSAFGQDPQGLEAKPARPPAESGDAQAQPESPK